MAVLGLVKIVKRLHNFRYNRSRYLVLNMQRKNMSSLEKPLNLDDPIKYSQTKASKMDTSDTFKIKPNPAVFRSEKYIIIVTTIVCLIYFGLLRKENKVDRILDGSFDYDEEDEIKILNALLHAKLKGLKTDDLEKKLQMIRQNSKKLY